MIHPYIRTAIFLISLNIFHVISICSSQGQPPVIKTGSHRIKIGRATPSLFVPGARKKSPWIVNHLFLNGEADNISNCKGATALMIAAEKGGVQDVERILAGDTDIDAVTPMGITALMIAAKHGHLDIVKRLVAKGARVNTPSYGPMPDMPKVRGYAKGFQKLVLFPFSTDKKCYKGLHNGFTPLALAIAYGHTDVVKFLVFKGADVNQKGFGASPLVIAVLFGYPDIAVYLIHKGAKVTSSELVLDGTIDLLQQSLDRGYYEVAYLILEREKRDLNASDHTISRIPMMHYYSGGGRTKGIAFLYKKGADINRYDKHGMTPILYAAMNGHGKAVELLLNYGAKVDSICKSPVRGSFGNHSGATPLILAIKKGHFALAEQLIQRRANCNIRDKKGMPPLMFAAAKGNKNVVKRLIDHKADINAKDTNGRQPVMHAAIAGDPSMVDLLLRKGADIHTTDSRGDGLIAAAVQSSEMEFNEDTYYKMVDFLIGQGADVNAGGAMGNTPLILAIRGGFFALAQRLIDRGADCNIGNKEGMTPLMFATATGNKQFVEQLISSKAHINAKDTNGRQPVMHAVLAGDPSMVDLLLRKGADIHTTDNRGNGLIITALRPRAKDLDGNKYYEMVEVLIRQGADVNAGAARGNTTLLHAVRYGSAKMVGLLIQKGADLEMADDRGQTPLFLAMKKKKLEIFETLIRSGANVNKPDKKGQSLLEYALYHRPIEYTSLLLDGGAHVNVTNKQRKSLLMIAIRMNKVDFADLYIQKGIDIHMKDKFGSTALMRASAKGNLDLVKKLVEKGAKVNVKDNDGITALMAAKSNGHTNVARYLAASGSDNRGWQKHLAEIKMMQEKGFIPKHTNLTNMSPSQLLFFKAILKEQGISDYKSWKPDNSLSSPEKTWRGYKKALKEGDIEAALKCLAPKFAKSQRKLFKAWGRDKMKKISEEMRPVERVSGNENRAKYRIKRKEVVNGMSHDITCSINFVNIYGEWKIESY